MKQYSKHANSMWNSHRVSVMHSDVICDAWGADDAPRCYCLKRVLACLPTECKDHQILAFPSWDTPSTGIWSDYMNIQQNSGTSINFQAWIYNHFWWATNLFNCKSIREWITPICATHSKRDIPECHFHLNLLNNDYRHCGAAAGGENDSHKKKAKGGLQ